ncbi:MAG: 5'-nucleotidase, lipoprotein e(P4) family [Alphaproteobacteria bacterium]|jgi:acid phosphatase|nr:5'-nucleotidase, lipoprotein e(P4) family [Alphaproteobacteria bacterium]
MRGKLAGFIAATGLAIGLGQARGDSMQMTQNDLLNATLWTQTSVEFKANALASYRLATVMLDRALADKSWTAASEQTGDYQAKPPAVILDIDETVLDNTEYEAWLIKQGTHYSSKTWGPYVDQAISKPIPGSLDFIKYAAAKGVEVFYVSNRKKPGEAGTRKNLEKFGYPVNDRIDTVLLRGENDWGRKKSTRRAHVAKAYRVLLVLGDNLNDFTDQAGGSTADRLKVYDKHMDRWGRSWIMIPNPMYGSWEAAAFKGNWKLDGNTRRQKKLEAMSYWPGPK